MMALSKSYHLQMDGLRTHLCGKNDGNELVFESLTIKALDSQVLNQILSM